ncbi:MAG: hypothetical protein MUF64_06740 [Polyangiaceae bacterium]|jgi:hypothetical protein|nr:hypothetical protein [Polyangiaceae bacterium]
MAIRKHQRDPGVEPEPRPPLHRREAIKSRIHGQILDQKHLAAGHHVGTKGLFPGEQGSLHPGGSFRLHLLLVDQVHEGHWHPGDVTGQQEKFFQILVVALREFDLSPCFQPHRLIVGQWIWFFMLVR